MTIRGTAQGRRIELDAALPFPDGQPVTVEVRADNSNQLGSTVRLLEAMRLPPHVSADDVTELESLIDAGCRTQPSPGEFDDLRESETA